MVSAIFQLDNHHTNVHHVKVFVFFLSKGNNTIKWLHTIQLWYVATTVTSLTMSHYDISDVSVNDQ